MAQKGRSWNLVKNVGLLTLGNFATRLLSFFLVPLYTNILTTSEYGIYDIIHTTVVLLVPILTVDIQEAVIRFALSKEYNKSSVLKTGLRYVGIGVSIMLIFTLLNHRFQMIKILDEYSIYFFLLFSLTALNQVFASFARGLDRVKDFTISSVLSSVVSISLNVWLLAFVKMGIHGYFISFIAGYTVSCLYLFFRLDIIKYIKEKGDNNIRKEMIVYSLPLVLNAVGWWLNSASDRYVVTLICGLAINGIYSVGYKIPSILNVFTTIFNEAWILSAVKEFESDDKDDFFSKTYNLYEFILLFVCSGLIITARLCALLLYKKDFYEAWIYVPFLNISVLFGALSGVIGGAFSAVKDSKIYSISTISGAIINVILDIGLVLKFGAIGAAIATMVSYFVVWAVRLVCVKKYITMKINLKRDIIAYIILGLQSAWLFIWPNNIVYYSVAALSFMIIPFLYKEELKIVLSKLKSGKRA